MPSHRTKPKVPCLQLSLIVDVVKRPGKKRGPKRKATSGVPHRARPVHKGRHPVHVTLRVRHGLPSLRQQMILRLVRQIIRQQREKAYGAEFQIVEHSIQSNHLHLLLEAADGPTLAPGTRKKNPLRSGITGFQRAFALRLNRLLGRAGPVFSGRYHRHDLATPREVRNALRYILQNHAKHADASRHGSAATLATPRSVVDPFSSALTFSGWKTPPPHAGNTTSGDDPPTEARTWLLARGWRRHGLIEVTEMPAR